MSGGVPHDGDVGRTIGENMKRERLAANMTQQQLADLSAHSRSYVAQTENGFVKGPGARSVYLWASVLGVRMEDLMSLPRIEHTSKGRFRAKAESNARQRDRRRERQRDSTETE